MEKISKKITLYLIFFFIGISLPFGVFHAYIIEKKHFERIQKLSVIGAELSSDLLNDMLSSYVIINDFEYVEIGYDEFNKMYGPVTEEYFKKIGTGKSQRYHTRYDMHPDVITIFTSIQEAFLSFQNIAFAILIDKNGYVPIHNEKFAQKATGNLERDKLFCREKRRWTEFVAEPLIEDKLFLYQRDATIKMFVARSEIYVNNQLWGYFLCAYDAKSAIDTFIFVIGKIIFVIFIFGILISFILPWFLQKLKVRYYGIR
jgi:hypothetical protein